MATAQEYKTYLEQARDARYFNVHRNYKLLTIEFGRNITQEDKESIYRGIMVLLGHNESEIVIPRLSENLDLYNVTPAQFMDACDNVKISWRQLMGIAEPSVTHAAAATKNKNPHPNQAQR